MYGCSIWTWAWNVAMDQSLECRTTRYNPVRSSFKLTKILNALYVMATLMARVLRGNVGLPICRTDSTSNGYDLTSVLRSHLKVSITMLPSLNVAYDLAADTILRFAASRYSLAQPIQYSACGLT